MALSRGRLFRLRLTRSAAARDEALASIRPLPGGWWQVRIGGKVRGATRRFVSRQAATAAVHLHYNAMLWKAIQR